MSLKQKVKLEMADGSEIVAEYSAVDLRAWEAKFHKSALTESMSVSMLTWLGWNSAVRKGQIDGELKDYRKFDESCESVEGVSDDEEVPTRPGSPKTRATRKSPGADSSAP